MRGRFPARSIARAGNLGDFVVDVLERLRVGQVRVRAEGVERVAEATPFHQVLRLVADSPETLFPVVDAEDRMMGIFSLRDVRLALGGSSLGSLVPATDLATRPVITVTPQDDLHSALKRLTELNLDAIPVVAPDDPTHRLGLLSRRELVSAYTAQIGTLRTPRSGRRGLRRLGPPAPPQPLPRGRAAVLRSESRRPERGPCPASNRRGVAVAVGIEGRANSLDF